jgi:hypothetical protein
VPLFSSVGVSQRFRKGKKFAKSMLKQYGRYEQWLLQPDSIGRFASSTYSQNGEDGIIAEIIKRLGLQELTFVEVGSSDGQENCTRLLLENGSVGLWIEGDREKAVRARELSPTISLEVVNEIIDCQNIMTVINNSTQVNSGFDLLVVDVDGNDWWLFKTILAHYSPQVIVAEYNPAYGPKKKWVMPYNALHTWKGDQNYGASLSAYDELFQSNGYRLIACDPSGTNGFWVKNEMTNLFGERRKRSGLFAQAPVQRMHPKVGVKALNDHLNSNDLSRIEIPRIECIRSNHTTKFIVICEVSNQLEFSISSAGNLPIRLGLRSSTSKEPIRASIVGSIDPGERGLAFALLDYSEDFSEIGIVQEGVAWSEQWKTC